MFKIRRKTYWFKAKGNMQEAWDGQWSNDGMSDPKQTISREPKLPVWLKAVDCCDKTIHPCLTEVRKFRAIGKLSEIFFYHKQNKPEIVLQQHLRIKTIR